MTTFSSFLTPEAMDTKWLLSSSHPSTQISTTSSLPLWKLQFFLFLLLQGPVSSQLPLLPSPASSPSNSVHPQGCFAYYKAHLKHPWGLFQTSPSAPNNYPYPAISVSSSGSVPLCVWYKKDRHWLFITKGNETDFSVWSKNIQLINCTPPFILFLFFF